MGDKRSASFLTVAALIRLGIQLNPCCGPCKINDVSLSFIHFILEYSLGIIEGKWFEKRGNESECMDVMVLDARILTAPFCV